MATCHPDRSHESKGLCKACYRAQWNAARGIRSRGPLPRGTLLDRCHRGVDRSGGPDACHPWIGNVAKGKPVVSLGKTNYAPRRVLFEQHHGVKLRFEQRVRSRCPGHLCCNIAHLWGGDADLRMSCLVDKSAGPDGCWPYMGARDHHGYGRLAEGRTYRGTRRFAHRLAYELANGPLVGHVAHTDDEILIMHTCDNPPCCNPKHLRPGTDQDNIADMLAKGRAAWQVAKATGQPWPPLKVAVGQSERPADE